MVDKHHLSFQSQPYAFEQDLKEILPLKKTTWRGLCGSLWCFGMWTCRWVFFLSLPRPHHIFAEFLKDVAQKKTISLPLIGFCVQKVAVYFCLSVRIKPALGRQLYI